MVFSSIVFLFFFFPLTLLLYFSLPGTKFRNVLLLLASLVFYAWGEPVFVLIMLFSCVVNYVTGLFLENRRYGKIPLIIGVVINLIILIIAKYSDFIVQNFNLLLSDDNKIDQPNLPLPIGISFFTFQAISYLVDIWRKDAHVQKNPLRLSLFISLFPQLIAGPIVRYHHIATELNRRVHHFALFRNGTERFITGLSKKVLLANPAGQLADNIMMGEAGINTPTAWIGLIAYTLQIYYDFSGYSDMAIGLGKVFGFNFHENFNYPYKSKSIQEFWRRWHISLSTWFRDYVYIPLGGNRKGTGRTYFNLITIFFFTGLWHGASWSFVFWGLFHGFFMLIERVGLKKHLPKIPVFNHIYTMLVVMVAWVFFKIESFSEALHYTITLFEMDLSSITVNVTSWQITAIIAGVLFSFNWWSSLLRDNHRYTRSLSTLKYTVLLILFVLCCLEIATSTYNPFIYYRF